MTRPRPSASRSWVLSWLLVVLTMAGLLLWQGGHCAAELSSDVTAGGAALSVDAPTVDAAAGDGSVIAPADRHDDRPSTLTLGGGPSTTAGDCRRLPATAASTNPAAAVSVPPGGRTVAPAPPACLVKQRALPGATLAYLGVSRT